MGPAWDAVTQKHMVTGSRGWGEPGRGPEEGANTDWPGVAEPPLLLVTRPCLTLCAPSTAVCQTALSVGFPRRECWSGLPFSSPTKGSNLSLLRWHR